MDECLNNRLTFRPKKWAAIRSRSTPRRRRRLGNYSRCVTLSQVKIQFQRTSNRYDSDMLSSDKVWNCSCKRRHRQEQGQPAGAVPVFLHRTLEFNCIYYRCVHRSAFRGCTSAFVVNLMRRQKICRVSLWSTLKFLPRYGDGIGLAPSWVWLKLWIVSLVICVN